MCYSLCAFLCAVSVYKVSYLKSTQVRKEVVWKSGPNADVLNQDHDAGNQKIEETIAYEAYQWMVRNMGGQLDIPQHISKIFWLLMYLHNFVFFLKFSLLAPIGVLNRYSLSCNVFFVVLIPEASDTPLLCISTQEHKNTGVQENKSKQVKE